MREWTEAEQLSFQRKVIREEYIGGAVHDTLDSRTPKTDKRQRRIKDYNRFRAWYQQTGNQTNEPIHEKV